MLTKPRTISILGTDTRVVFYKEDEDAKLADLGGYFDASENLIVVKIPEADAFSLGNLEGHQKKVLRHEIVHAFLYHSGLDWSSTSADSWATNEEMVDWFAIQAPKIFRVFQEEGLM